LGFNGIADTGARALADALANNGTLTHLDVSHNRIGCAGALSLAEGLRANQTLVSCELSNNPMAVGEGLKISLEGVQVSSIG
jgi:predicted O-methyltransferase YrrM